MSKAVTIFNDIEQKVCDVPPGVYFLSNRMLYQKLDEKGGCVILNPTKRSAEDQGFSRTTVVGENVMVLMVEVELRILKVIPPDVKWSEGVGPNGG